MKNQDSVSISLDKTQLKQLKQEAVGDRAYIERVSIALALRLLNISDPKFDRFAVLDELDCLEGIYRGSRTKPATQFVSAPLFPFWHKHFFSARHLIKNIGIRWNLDSEGNKDLGRILNEVMNQHGDNLDTWPAYLADRLVRIGFEERAKRGLTGDWLIFAKYNDMNYYLDLATHEEGIDDNAPVLFEKLKNGSRAEFPFLFE